MGPRGIPEEWVRDDKVVHYIIPKLSSTGSNQNSVKLVSIHFWPPVFWHFHQ